MKLANELLWKIYQDSNCSQTEFCRKLGYKVSNSSMSLWLSGKKDLSLNKLIEFCDRLKINYTINIEI